MLLHGLRSFAMLCALLAVSCGSTSESQYEALVLEYGSQLEQFSTLSQTHSSTVATTTDLGALEAEESQYHTDAVAIQEQLVAVAAQLEGCAMMEDMNMSGMVAHLGHMLDGHQTAMGEAADLTEAQAEELEDAEAMDAMLEDMEADYDAMYGMIGMDGMGC